MKWQNKTRSGQPVRFYCEDAGGQYPIHGAVQSKYDDAWEAVIWTDQGLFHIDDWHEYDLVPAKVRRWKTAEELIAEGYARVMFSKDCIQVWPYSNNSVLFTRYYVSDLKDFEDLPKYIQIFTVEE